MGRSAWCSGHTRCSLDHYATCRGGVIKGHVFDIQPSVGNVHSSRVCACCWLLPSARAHIFIYMGLLARNIYNKSITSSSPSLHETTTVPHCLGADGCSRDPVICTHRLILYICMCSQQTNPLIRFTFDTPRVDKFAGSLYAKTVFLS